MKENKHLKGNDRILAQLHDNADNLDYLCDKLVVVGKKEIYESLKIQIDELKKTVAAIQLEQGFPDNFIF